MTYRYKIINFDAEQGTFVIEFEGYNALNFMAPFINGSYLNGQALDNHIQTLYPQILSHEDLLTLVKTISGGEGIVALIPPPINISSVNNSPKVLYVESTKSIYYPNETIDATITFDGPITSNTYINIRVEAGNLGVTYMPSRIGALGIISLLENRDESGQVLDMKVGDTTARYTGLKYLGIFNVDTANISVKAMTDIINGDARQDYIVSNNIQLRTETV